MNSVCSNRTLTAKFTATLPPEPILSISIVDKEFDERGGSLGHLDYGEVEERVSGGYLVRTYKIFADKNGDTPNFVTATPDNSNQFLGWYDQNRNLISNRPYLDNREIDDYRRLLIYASFSGQATPDGAPSQVTIKLYSSKADGSLGGKGKVGFSSGSLSYTTQTKVVGYGEKVTIYAEGDEIVGDYTTTHYYCTGFFLDSGAALKNFFDNARLQSYTFTATRDMDISAGWEKYNR